MVLNVTSRDAAAEAANIRNASQSLLASLGASLSDPSMGLMARRDVPEAFQGQGRLPQYGVAMGMVPQQSPHINAGVFPPETAAQVEQTRRTLAGVSANAP